MRPAACFGCRNAATFNLEAKMTAPRMTVLIRLGRAKDLTRSSSAGMFPEIDNPLERYV